MKERDEFQDVYLKTTNKNSNRQKLIRKVASKNNIALVCSFVNKRRTKKGLLKYNLDQIEESFELCLSNILKDIHDYRHFSLEKGGTPTAVKNNLNRVKRSLEALVEIDPVIERLIERPIKEETHAEAVEYETRLQIIEVLQNNCVQVLNKINVLLPVVTSDLILSARLEQFRDARSKLFKICYTYPNKLLLIMTYHLNHFCNDLKVESKNSKAEFISLVANWINDILTQSISRSEGLTSATLESIRKMGDLSSISKGTVLELFRSESWGLLQNK